MNRYARWIVVSGFLVTACDSSEAVCDSSALATICTIAGSGESGYDRDADTTRLPAREAKFSLPQDTLTGPDDEVYILDWNNHRLRLLEQDSIRWIAGRGELGGDLDDPANNDFNHPTNIIFDATGANILVAAWHNSKIRTVDIATGTVSDSCGDGKRAYYGDGGLAAASSLDLPASLAFDPTGRLVVMDQANQVLRYIDGNGNIERLAGRCIVDAAPPAGPGACAADEELVQCPAGPNGPSGKATCGDPAIDCAKPCTPGYSGDDIAATELRMSQPFGQSAAPAGRIVFDSTGNLYFADTSNQLIRMIGTDGMVRRIAGTPPVDGVPQSGYAGDGGPASEATLNFPVDLAFGDDGTLYFTDVRNHCVRAVAPDGTIDTVVGVCGENGYEGDGGPPEEALLNLPFGIEFVRGRLHIADTGNNVVRSVLL